MMRVVSSAAELVRIAAVCFGVGLVVAAALLAR
jgi:hypothetical protein